MRLYRLLLVLLPSLIGLIVGLPASLNAQAVYISRMSPGAPTNPYDVLCRIELFNASDEPVDLSGYVVVTRYFGFSIPKGTRILPLKRIRMGKQANQRDLEIEARTLGSWKERDLQFEEEGDFVALLSPDLEMVDGFFFSPRASVNFLPSEEILQLQGKSTRVRVPDETAFNWGFLRNQSDPAMAFVRINNRWRPNSRTRNLLPATQYRSVSTRYTDGVATIKWQTLFERDCYQHVLERSTDGKNFRTVDKVSGPINSEEGFEYLLYDAQVEKNRLYYYRITSTDKFGFITYSKPAKLRTEESLGEFTFDIIQSDRQRSQSFDVRFSSKESQRVRVQLMDEQLREISVLFYGDVEGKRQTLINFQQELLAGKYYLIVATEKRRYYEPLIIE